MRTLAIILLLTSPALADIEDRRENDTSLYAPAVPHLDMPRPRVIIHTRQGDPQTGFMTCRVPSDDGPLVYKQTACLLTLPPYK